MLEVAVAPLPATTSDVGIDLGRTSMAVLSNGEVIENPKHVRRRALARAQQALAAKTKGSKRRACCWPASQGRPDSPGSTTTSWPNASPAITRRSMCRTWTCPAWPARGRQGQSATPASRRWSDCWRRRHCVAGGLWSRSAASSRPVGCARRSGSTPGASPSMSGPGPARSARPPAIMMSTLPGTFWLKVAESRRAGADPQRSWRLRQRRTCPSGCLWKPEPAEVPRERHGSNPGHSWPRGCQLRRYPFDRWQPWTPCALAAAPPMRLRLAPLMQGRPDLRLRSPLKASGDADSRGHGGCSCDGHQLRESSARSGHCSRPRGGRRRTESRVAPGWP